MSALAFARDGRGWEDAGHGGGRAGGSPDAAGPAQPRLFALPGGAVDDAPEAVAAPAVEAPETLVAAAPEVAPVRTLDAVLTAAFGAVAAGRTASCFVCDGPLRPRWSAGAGAVGGRCADCGSSID